MSYTSRASLQIQKPIATVFDAVVDPVHLTKYFISESSGRLETGKDVLWKFPEFEERFPITQVVIEDNHSVSFVWDPETHVHISFVPQEDGSTVVNVAEGSKEATDENMQWLISNIGGWANFLSCMKAYLEYGIQLRKGAYDFMSEL